MCLHNALQTERNLSCPPQKMSYTCITPAILQLINPAEKLDSLAEAHTVDIYLLFLSWKYKQSKITTAQKLRKSKFLSHHLLVSWV